MKRIVLIAGFESFNAGLYRQAADLAQSQCSQLDIRVFSDRDLTSNPTKIEAALQQADVFFASLLFDYDQVLWLRERVQTIPIRLVFESALELMSLTQLGKFAIGDKPKGMPKPVKFILDKFSNGREEDKLAGYISFLKTGPKLLKFVPVQKVQDLRNWLIIYGYWNAGGTENVAALFCTIAQKYLGLTVGEIADPIETPNIGLLHPEYDGYFESPKQYLDWYRQRFNSDHPTVGILLYRKHVITNQQYIPKLIKAFEKANLIPVPIFINGVEGHVAVRDLMTTDYEQQQRDRGINATLSLSDQAVKVDAIVSTIGFPLVGGPAGSMEAGRQIEVAKRILSAKNVPYIVAAPLLIQDIHSWTRQGIGGLQSVVLYALPELDGAIDTIALGGLVGETIYLIPERVDRLTGRLNQWIKLRQTPAEQRKIAILLYGFPPGYGAVGTAALLNVPRSLIKLLQAMKEQGYAIADLPEDGETLIQAVKSSDEGDAIAISTQTLGKWLGYLLTSRVEKQWKSLSNSGIKTLGDDLVWGGVQLGNVWIGVQPPLGISGDPMRLMFERDLTPHPQYAAFYKWLQNDFGADAIVHFGMHGTVEWLPGSPLGNTGYSWSDILLGNLPNLYVYAANNPSESILAKRRGYGTLISHNVPPYGRAGLYKELVNIRDLIAEYREDPEKNYALKSAIVQKIIDIGIDADCPFAEAKQLGIAFNLENINLFSNDAFNRYLITLYEYLQVLENRLFSSGLHTLGEMPSPEMLESYLKAYFDDRIPESSIAQIAQGEDLAQWQEAVDIRNLLLQTTDELTNLLRGLNGEYIPPAPGGDLLRDGLGALPTGRNIHALDPYRMPSPAAYERGREIARKIIDQHLKEHQTYPETVAVMLWGLDAIKTKGESIGILLELVGAEPVKEGTGRIVRYELKPISEVGHPRIDVLANLSGIFRDSFVNIIELLDDLFQRAAELDEPADQNFIRKHAIALQTQGVDNPTARLFSNPAGDYGSLVNDQVVSSNWESGEELGQTWQSRNVFSYGRKDKGEVRSQVLETLLKTTDRIVQEIDSVEYGLTDIQEYYANTGGLKRAAEQQKGTKVQASFVESFSKDTTPRNLEDLLRMEYRTKLLNPKWAEAMAAQGSGGAYEISQRMTALIGWSGTVDFKESWVYDQAADTYALDADMAKRLQEANPEAFRNIVARMLEANGRGFWNPDDEKLSKLRALYEQSDRKLEGVEIASV
ncbi:ChlH protein [Leptolyngbya boryana NIES-2135]|jgi:magnesium chelatase subunit H|uniref:magnesium chelatase n=1 Tax=Leptolyngbya boryana NIES-2135 TaxID=1973484 RepID=A0A1Z4JJC5_LEPBY|nr:MULTISPECIES: magnesium chelatase subunit H [Leptolyngbya]BAY56852.1 ChlH protein [Leptolyngbya boryana NIES-2135]MBD2368929.1 magnesium chelatase subunit H [Leptolyngbya sp. FACHB-161]MBD2375864.1 magnesium chelatase subunit H [Leptolyngbya sp. FACHB-238]MBD2399978.1 magnesium chelatase subunit H [Leptolyngbya sp. FACHB-239]MBD2406184.1 magnesium chelatase subunit H [Leptolyngbya sp. FACHB-402]